MTATRLMVAGCVISVDRYAILLASGYFNGIGKMLGLRSAKIGSIFLEVGLDYNYRITEYLLVCTIHI